MPRYGHRVHYIMNHGSQPSSCPVPLNRPADLAAGGIADPDLGLVTGLKRAGLQDNSLRYGLASGPGNREELAALLQALQRS